MSRRTKKPYYLEGNTYYRVRSGLRRELKRERRRSASELKEERRMLDSHKRWAALAAYKKRGDVKGRPEFTPTQRRVIAAIWQMRMRSTMAFLSKPGGIIDAMNECSKAFQDSLKVFDKPLFPRSIAVGVDYGKEETPSL